MLYYANLSRRWRCHGNYGSAWPLQDRAGHQIWQEDCYNPWYEQPIRHSHHSLTNPTRDSMNRALGGAWERRHGWQEGWIYVPEQEGHKNSSRQWHLTWTEGDDRTGLSLDLNSNSIVYFLFSTAGCSSSFGLRAATAPVTGHRLCPTGPGARSPLWPLTPATWHCKQQSKFRD